jgi:hypothetical protein
MLPIIKRGRVSTSSSSLAQPRKPIHQLAAKFQRKLYLPDPTPLYVTLGALAGNMLTGKPVWLMLVGSSSSGKTALLKCVLGVERTRAVAAIKNESAFLSGVKRKDHAKDATGGILREMGDCGCLVFTDFTSILSKPRDSLNEILSALRQIYDRDWMRDIGGEGGRSMTYTGRISFLGACTHAIDRYQSMSAEMGERILYYRMPETDGYEAARRASNDTEPEQNDQDRKDWTKEMFEGMALSLQDQTKRRDLQMHELDRIIMLAQFASRARSVVPREFGTKQVLDIPSIEMAPRMAQSMSQLYAGMEKIGVTVEERWSALKDVAMGCMPLQRRMVLKTLQESEAAAEGVSGKLAGEDGVRKIAHKVMGGEQLVRRVLEDLRLLGLVKESVSKGYQLSDWARDRLVGKEDK